MHRTLIQIHPLAVTIYDHRKMTVDNQSMPVNISDMHFEGKQPNLMTVFLNQTHTGHKPACLVSRN